MFILVFCSPRFYSGISARGGGGETPLADIRCHFLILFYSLVLVLYLVPLDFNSLFLLACFLLPSLFWVLFLAVSLVFVYNLLCFCSLHFSWMCYFCFFLNLPGLSFLFPIFWCYFGILVWFCYLLSCSLILFVCLFLLPFLFWVFLFFPLLMVFMVFLTFCFCASTPPENHGS